MRSHIRSFPATTTTTRGSRETRIGAYVGGFSTRSSCSRRIFVHGGKGISVRTFRRKMIPFTNTTGDFFIFHFRHQFPLFFLLFFRRFPLIGQFPDDIFAYLCCFEVWTWLIALFSSEFRPCFAGCDSGGDSFLFEDCADFTGCTVFEAGGG